MALPGIDGVWSARPRTGAAVALGVLATLLGVAALLLLAPPAGERLLGGRAWLVGPLRIGVPLVLLALWIVILLRHDAHRLAAALGLGAACFLVYERLTLPAAENVSANAAYVPAALRLVRGGEPTVATAPARPAPVTARETPRRASAAPRDSPRRTPAPSIGAHVTTSPDATEPTVQGSTEASASVAGIAVAIAPFAWLADGVLDGSIPPPRRWERVADAVADALGAITVALLFVAARRLGAEPRLALCGALVLAFCTPHLSLHAGGLWSHNVSAALWAAALVLALPGGGEPMAAGAAWSGALAGLATLARPGALALTLLPLVIVGARRRAAALFWLLPFVLVIGLAVLSSPGSLRSSLAALLPSHLLAALGTPSLVRWGRAAWGLLVSPNRGLLVFCPLLVFAVGGAGLGIAVSDGWKRRFYVAAALCSIATVAIAAGNPRWWDGAGYGPRHLADLLPLLALLLLPVVQWLLGAPSWSRIAGSGLLVLALTASAVVAWRGATAPATREWNVNPPASEARAWDWSDLQALRRSER